MSLRATALVAAMLMLTMLPLLSGCDGGSDATLRLLGRVLDNGSLQPIPGARVIVGSREATTNALGRFDLLGVPAGGQATVAATGYLSATVPIPAGSDEIDLGDIFLVPAPVAGTGNITGTVTEAGVAAGGASVRAAGREARTRANGTYTLYNVPSGFQTVFAVSADESTAASNNVNVLSGMTITVNLQLSTQPPPPPG